MHCNVLYLILLFCLSVLCSIALHCSSNNDVEAQNGQLCAEIPLNPINQSINQYIVMCCIVLCYIVLHWFVLWCFALCCIALDCIRLHCIVLCCIELCCIAFHCIGLY